MTISEVCAYLEMDIKVFMAKAIEEKVQRVEAKIEQAKIEADPKKCNKCGGPHQPPGDICNECWGSYYKNNIVH